MKRLILAFAGSLLIFIAAAQAQTDDNNDATPASETVNPSHPDLSTSEGAKEYVNRFYQLAGLSYFVCASSSSFVAKELAGGRYMVAKIFITDGRTGEQFTRGIVVDVDTDWIVTLTPSDYHAFLRTGNKAYLREKVLDPNS
jgi:hypothetical protein